MIFHIYANKSNIGDWLSARGIQSLLTPHKVIELFCDESYLEETLESLKKASDHDFVVIGSGGLFMDYFIPFWEGFRNSAPRVPFCIWGVGYCDLKLEDSQPPVELLEEIINQSQFCVVRDEMTRNHLSRCKLPPPVPCPSISVIDEVTSKGFGLLHIDNYLAVGEDVYEAMVEYGREFAKRTNRRYRAKNNRIPFGNEDILSAILGLYTSSDIVLSSGLHGCIIGLAMGLKVVAVSGDYKIESFMQAAGLSDWVIDLKEIHSLPDRLTNISEQPAPMKFLQSARQANRAIAEDVKRAIEIQLKSNLQ